MKLVLVCLFRDFDIIKNGYSSNFQYTMSKSHLIAVSLIPFSRDFDIQIFVGDLIIVGLQLNGSCHTCWTETLHPMEMEKEFPSSRSDKNHYVEDQLLSNLLTNTNFRSGCQTPKNATRGNNEENP